MAVFHDARGYRISTDNALAAAEIFTALENFLHWRADLMPHVKAALAADPACGFAQALHGLLLYGTRNAAFRPMVVDSLKAANAARGAMSAREGRYVDALAAASAGRITEAVSVYEQILAADPTDLLAQRLAQFELFWLGEMAWSADISGRVAPAWNENIPGYSAHLGCRAFDLEETHQFGEAERIGRESVARDPAEVWGTHAVAHVLIMQGRHADGIAWLDGLKDNWAMANQMSLHLWWHRCLFHLERGETDAALAIYDAWVRNRDLPVLKGMPDLYIDMQNGASMLIRLELRGIDVGDRWDELAELTLKRLDDHSSPFTSAHYVAILAAAGHFAEAETAIASMTTFAHADDGTLGPVYLAAGIPAAKAALAHRKGDHEAVIRHLLPARRALWRMGGSHAQRDLFFILLVDSASKLDRRDILSIALADIAGAGFVDVPGRVAYRDAAAALA
ncbi:tetratricopeptide repeat protein [Oceanibacterium hippocampi]|uniref:Tetratricopeptide repeat protein 38 n=1 Tax=Oceanibacterium hippocampi TaxID=745714 RepID=A0A1Y5TQA8_9PROT|nr:tetratricopeptide repeat protein [Oceanibacterium hippocampi]SLN69363.1 hypothetical protein OCH7691_03183 [Oceanibacterium hippocampi]